MILVFQLLKNLIEMLEEEVVSKTDAGYKVEVLDLGLKLTLSCKGYDVHKIFTYEDLSSLRDPIETIRGNLIGDLLECMDSLINQGTHGEGS